MSWPPEVRASWGPQEMDATQTAEQEDEEAVGPGSGDEDEKSLFSPGLGRVSPSLV